MNSTGPWMTTIVCPCGVTYQSRSGCWPCFSSVAFSASAILSACPSCRRSHSDAEWTPGWGSVVNVVSSWGTSSSRWRWVSSRLVLYSPRLSSTAIRSVASVSVFRSAAVPTAGRDRRRRGRNSGSGTCAAADRGSDPAAARRDSARPAASATWRPTSFREPGPLRLFRGVGCGGSNQLLMQPLDRLRLMLAEFVGQNASAGRRCCGDSIPPVAPRRRPDSPSAPRRRRNANRRGRLRTPSFSGPDQWLPQRAEQIRPVADDHPVLRDQPSRHGIAVLRPALPGRVESSQAQAARNRRLVGSVRAAQHRPRRSAASCRMPEAGARRGSPALPPACRPTTAGGDSRNLACVLRQPGEGYVQAFLRIVRFRGLGQHRIDPTPVRLIAGRSPARPPFRLPRAGRPGFARAG